VFNEVSEHFLIGANTICLQADLVDLEETAREEDCGLPSISDGSLNRH
jgi:hypothetical protein